MPQATRYEDFEVEIRSTESGWEARVLRGPTGGASHPFVLPFAEDRLEALLTALERRIGRSGRAVRDLPEAPDSAPGDPDVAPEEVGHRLFAALFDGDVGSRLRESLAAARASGSIAGLHLRLRFDRAEDFSLVATLPWELLCDGRRFLARDRATPIARSLDVPGLQVPTDLEPPWRVLLVDSAPSDRPKLATAEEGDDIGAILRSTPGICPRLLDHPDPARLRAAILDFDPHVVHFMGHGGYLDDGGDERFVLDLENGHGGALPLGGPLVADHLLTPSGNLFLVVLNACWGGALPRLRGRDPFTAVAASIVERNVPAVVAMQFPISDPAALAFSRRLYERLATGDTIEQAVVEARLAILADDPESLEWATPVLLHTGGQLPRLAAPGSGTSVEGEGTPSPGARNGERQRPLRLAVYSFGDARAWKVEAEPDAVLDLSEHFVDNRYIRRPELWGEVIFPALESFLRQHAAERRPLVLDFAAHATIAFAAGYCLEAKSGLDVTLHQRGPRGTQTWKAEAGPSHPGPLFAEAAERRRDPGSDDVALALGITHDVLDDVEAYLDRSGIAVGRILPALLAPEPDPMGVEGGLHALELARELTKRLRRRSVAERGAVLHLFAAAPNTLLFFLGQLGRALGDVQLYEHDFDRKRHRVAGYMPSLRLPVG